ncbi:MAG: branched-chain amino acid ABC transporter permease [Candidatus Eremiobacteraeota bacterium]|nr:branched-chain amino acid ABC transporter permease [Candidatus Eremiobacteraeota bacterium]MBV8367054.1 branched-chain amino acid ABC transporter permease [Candidatus Eremiobacteraeota bacterium]
MHELVAAYHAHSALLNEIGINALLALSVWVTLACGQLSLGNMGFMAIAAYASVLLVTRGHWPFFGAALTGAAMAAAAGLLLGWPVLRLRGVFLAIATIGFGEIVRIFAINLPFTGGAEGIAGIPQLVTTAIIYSSLALIAFLLWRLTRSRAGRAFAAIAQDEVAASGLGINPAAYKLAAFAIGAFIAGYAGALAAFSSFFISPSDYSFGRAVDVLAFAVAGGIGSVAGPIAGAALLTLLPEWLRFLQNYRDVVNGAILLLVIIFLPQGVWSIVRRRSAR